jgi:tetratricopeptide (TPR) repeat protein
MEDNHFLETKGKKLSEYIIKGKSNEVISEINRLIDEFPERRSVLYYMLAEHYMLNKQDGSLKNYHAAIEVLKKLIELEGAQTRHRSSALTNIAFAYREIGDIDKAIFYLEKSFNEYPVKFDNNPEYKEKIKTIYDELLQAKSNLH